MKDDAELLRCYAIDRSEPAFSELVERHVGMVYSAALRRTGGDRQLAADAAQQVFTTLARDARKLSNHTVLSAWLHTATRNAALNLVMSEQRRKTRERTSAALVLESGSTPEWEQLRPVLDAAIDELPEADRAAVVLRFLERRPFAEIGAVLRVTDDSARMRAERALEKLRVALARQGITSTAAALATIGASQALASAPAGLATTLAQTALAAAGTGWGIAALISSLMTSKIVATALVSGVAAFAIGGYLGVDRASHAPLPPQPELPQHSQLIAALRRDVAALRLDRDRISAENATLSGQLRAAQAAQTRPVSNLVPTSGVPNSEAASVARAMMNNLRQIAAARDQFFLENKRPAASMDELVGETKYIRRLNPVDGEDYSSVPLYPKVPITVVTPKGVSITYDPTGTQSTQLPPVGAPSPSQLAREQMRRVEPAVTRAMAAYQSANSGGRPATPEALLPYFATPQEGADFVEALEAQKETRR